MLMKYQETEEEKRKREMEEDEEEMKKIFGSSKIRRLNDSDEEAESKRLSIKEDTNRPSNTLLSGTQKHSTQTKLVKQSISTSLSKGSVKKKAQLLGIVKKKVDSGSKSTISSGDRSNENVSVSTENVTAITTTPSAAGLGLLGAYGSDDSNSGEGE